MSKYHIRKVCLAGLAVFLLGAATARPAQAQQTLGERLDQGIDRLSSELREGWASLRESVDRMGVQARVYSRLRWDKQLADSEVDVDVRDSSTVVLRGQVASPAAKQKAVELANDTVGVSRVVDELTVKTPADPVSEPPAP